MTRWDVSMDDSDLPMRREYDEARESRARMRREAGYRQPAPMPYGYDPANISNAEAERRAYGESDAEAERRCFDPNYGRS